ncbi:MAG TPA: DUF302 domain-containing protein [Candidatus Nanopelagicaceae bacterium]|nr:DUF302 domain-containing protein [Candidatus Nanopelagicaceae bacterium]
MKYVNSASLDLPFETAVAAVQQAFAEQGFGLLTTVDVQKTLREKIGREIDPYVILGICNPTIADQVLSLEPQVGALLPCSVAIRWDGERTLVHALDPGVIVELDPSEGLRVPAGEASRRMDLALASLKEVKRAANGS